MHADRRVRPKGVGSRLRFKTVPDTLASLCSADGRMSSLVQGDVPWAARRLAHPLGAPDPSTCAAKPKCPARFGPTSMRKLLSKPEQDEFGTSQTSIRHPP